MHPIPIFGVVAFTSELLNLKGFSRIAGRMHTDRGGRPLRNEGFPTGHRLFPKGLTSNGSIVANKGYALETMMKILISIPFLILFFAGEGSGQGGPQVLWSVDGHFKSVEAVAYSHDGLWVASGADYDDSQVKVWRASNGELVHTLSGHDAGVRSIEFSPDGRLLAVGHLVSGYPPGGQTKLWDIEKEVVRFTLGGSRVAFSKAGTLIATGGGGVNRYLQVHRVSDGQQVAQFYAGAYITSVSFSPDGTIVATGGTDNAIKLWDVFQGSLLRTLTGHADDVRTVAFSPDGTMIASGAGGWDSPGESSIKLWRVADGSLIDTLPGHGDWVTEVVFSPDAKLLVSTGRDGIWPDPNPRIKYWRVLDGALIQDHEELAFDLAFSPDGRQLVYGQGVLVLAANPVDAFDTHLYYANSAYPGATVDLILVGPPGTSPVALWVGSGVLDPSIPSSFGPWYLSFPVFGPFMLTQIPANGVLKVPVTLPPSIPGPYDLALQAVIGNELTPLCVLATH